MRYYLDTNILIFLLTNKDSISNEVQHILSNYENMFFTSSVCIMETIHLFQTKKLQKKAINIKSIIQKIEDFNITIKPIQKQHLQTLAELPLYANHTDPNDRLIIAQAISDKMPLISSDLKFALYTTNKLDFIKNKR